MIPYVWSKDVSIQLAGPIVVEKRSSFQRTVVIDNPSLGRTLLIGDEETLIIQLSEKYEAYYHELLVHPPMALHPNPRRVLIIGGGDGGCAREVLKHAVESVQMVEIDGDIVDLCRNHLPIHQGALDDQRLELLIDDGKRFIEDCRQKFDVILLDLTDPGPASQSLFTSEFFRSARDRLCDQGVLAIQTSSPISEPQVLGRIHSALNEAFQTVIPYSAYIPCFFTELSICTALNQPVIEISPILRKRGIDFSVFSPAELSHRLRHPSAAVRHTLGRDWKAASMAAPVDLIE